EEVALAEIAAQDVVDPDAELLPDRLIEAELLANRGDLVRGGVVARDHRRRIAGREPQHQEDEHRHHREDRDDGDEASGDEVEHRGQALSTFHMTASGAFSQPLTLERVAPGPYHWPIQPYCAVSMARAWTLSAISFCLPGSVSRA